MQRRKYCLECSPFDQHNTKALEKIDSNFVKTCLTCGKQIIRKEEKGRYCWTCSNRKNRESKLAKVKELTGEACWFCGYSKYWGALEFHHVNPEEKEFQLSKREMQFTWERIEPELKKCVLACACCHREIHGNLIEPEEVRRIWLEKWDITRSQ